MSFDPFPSLDPSTYLNPAKRCALKLGNAPRERNAAPRILFHRGSNARSQYVSAHAPHTLFVPRYTDFPPVHAPRASDSQALGHRRRKCAKKRLTQRNPSPLWKRWDQMSEVASFRNSPTEARKPTIRSRPTPGKQERVQKRTVS